MDMLAAGQLLPRDQTEPIGHPGVPVLIRRRGADLQRTGADRHDPGQPGCRRARGRRPQFLQLRTHLGRLTTRLGADLGLLLLELLIDGTRAERRIGGGQDPLGGTHHRLAGGLR